MEFSVRHFTGCDMRPPSGLAGSRLPQDVVDALLFEQRNRKFAGEICRRIFVYKIFKDKVKRNALQMLPGVLSFNQIGGDCYGSGFS